MTSRLGTYWSVQHRRQQDYAYFKALQPSVFKIMDGGPPDYQFARDNLPGALVVARDWALSEQHSDMLADPVGTGQRHAREWNEHQPKLGFDKNRTLVLGINEPTVWQPGFPEALRQYTIALCDEATKFSLRVGAMQLGVGWPGNNGPDTPPDWSPFHGVEEAILRGNHALICHEYWADGGPSENFGWWAGRTLKCPWQVPIIIGETGVDMFVKDTSVGQQNRGWLGHMPPERYAAELAEYVSRMSADPRFVGCCVFASDFAAHEWYSFDVEPAYKAILATSISVAPDAPPFETHIPALGNGPTQPAKTMYVAMSNGVNLRKAPLTGGIIVAIPYGEAVTVYPDDTGTNWSLAEYQGQSGYIRTDLLDATPPTAAPTPNEPLRDDCWQRSIAFILKEEGGYTGNDEGHPANFGINQGANPDLDVAHITREQAIERYRTGYWIASHANTLAWPFCLLVMDAAVQHGDGVARQLLDESGGNMLKFQGLRQDFYSQIKQDSWQRNGRAWMARMGRLLLEASK